MKAINIPIIFVILFLLNMIYLPFSKSESLYESIGCWNDKVARAIRTLEGNEKVTSIIDGHYIRRSREVEKCYRAALSLGYDTFAVQDSGQCFSSANAATTYNKYGKSTKCYGGTGGPMANDVYRINYGYIKTKTPKTMVNKGNSYELSCEFVHVNLAHGICAWKSPDGKMFQIWPGVKHEGGRIQQTGNMEKECNILINNANEEDNGKWQCQLAYVDSENDAIPKSKDVDVEVDIVNMPT